MGEVILTCVTQALVEIMAPEIIERSDMVCKCDKCRKDVMAVALNNLDCTFTTTYQGEILTRLNAIGIRGQKIIETEIIKAIEFVKERPMHQ